MYLKRSNPRTSGENVCHDDLETAEKMLATRTGLQAKYLSRTIREKAYLRTKWNKQRRSIMCSLVSVKFVLHDYASGTHQSLLK